MHPILLAIVVLSATEPDPSIRGQTLVLPKELQRSVSPLPFTVLVKMSPLFTVLTAQGSRTVATLTRTRLLVPCTEARVLSSPLPTVTVLVLPRNTREISRRRLRLATIWTPAEVLISAEEDRLDRSVVTGLVSATATFLFLIIAVLPITLLRTNALSPMSLETPPDRLLIRECKPPMLAASLLTREP